MRAQRWLVTGASGQLGSHVISRLLKTCATCAILAVAGRRGLGVDFVRSRQLDLAKGEMLRSMVAEFQPTHIVHLGAIAAIADCVARPAVAELVNTEATRILAEMAQDIGARLVFASTTMVFDGTAPPYREDDPPNPLNHYGRTKLAAEQHVARADRSLVVRLPLMYGTPCWRMETRFSKLAAALRAGEPLRVFTDEYRVPAWLGDVARAIVGLACSDVTGVIHVTGPERLSRHEMTFRWAHLLGIPRPNLVPTSRLTLDVPEPRPADLTLDISRLRSLFPDLLPGPIRPEAFADYYSGSLSASGLWTPGTNGCQSRAM